MKITRNFDMSRFSEYVKRPGIDPRTWVSLAIVAHDYTYNTNTQAYEFIADENDIKKDKYGIYASVILIPGFTKALYPIAPAYAGNFGLIYMPLHPLDTVVVEFPDGALSNGLITKRRNTGTEQINPDQIDLTNAWIVLESGASVNVILPQGDVNLTNQGGNLNVNVDSSHAVNVTAKKINLGSNSASYKAVLGDILENLFTKWVTTVFPAHTHSGVTSGSASTGNATPIASPLDGTELSNIVKVDS